MQIARREVGTWALFIIVGLILAYCAGVLWKKERYFSSVYCALVIAALVGIAATDPYSQRHLDVFAGLVLISIIWIWATVNEHGGVKLLLCGVGAFAGAVYCFVSLGIGERVFLLSTLGCMNFLYYDHVLF